MTKVLFRQSKSIKRLLIATYILVVLGISAAAKADVSALPVFGNGQFHASSLVGQLIYSTEGAPYLFLNEDTAILLKSRLDLTPYHGQVIEVVGIDLKNNGGPVYEVSSQDPLQRRQDSGTGTSVFFVFKVKEVSQ